jgi:hypothetical protein
MEARQSETMSGHKNPGLNGTAIVLLSAFRRECSMMTKTVRSRFDHKVGGTVEGCTILEKRTVIPPDPAERRLGVYDYLVEVPPTPMKSGSPRKPAAARGSFTRSTPDERGGVVRRLPSR